MRIYYRGPDAVVTDERFVWRAAAPRIFAVRELHHIGLVRADVADRRSDVALVAAAGMVAGAAAAWVMVGPVLGAALGFVAAVTAVVAVTARRLRTVRMWQVRATYHGVVTMIYESPDARVFNQVTRALRRAIEDGRPAQTGRDLAVA